MEAYLTELSNELPAHPAGACGRTDVGRNGYGADVALLCALQVYQWAVVRSARLES